MADYLSRVGSSLLEGASKALQDRLYKADLHRQRQPILERFKSLGFSEPESDYLSSLEPNEQIKALELFSKVGNPPNPQFVQQFYGQSGQPQSQPQQQGTLDRNQQQSLSQPQTFRDRLTNRLSPKISEELNSEAATANETIGILDQIDQEIKSGPFRTGIQINALAKAGLLPQKYEKEKRLYNLFQALLALEQQSKSKGGRGSDFLRKIVESGKLSLDQTPKNLEKILSRVRQEQNEKFKNIERRRVGLPVQQNNSEQSDMGVKVNSLNEVKSPKNGTKAYNPNTKQWSIYENGWRKA